MQNVILNAPSGYLIEEIHRKDLHIHEQQKKIDLLEMELARSKQKIEELLNQLSKCSENGYKSAQGRYWSPEEHQRFLEGLKRYGSKDVKSISLHVGTRNATQVRTHAQKYFLRLEKEKTGEITADASSNDESSFNNNKEKDEQEENDVQEESSDKDPVPTNNDNNTMPPEPSNDEPSPTSTPPVTTNGDAKPPARKPLPTKPKATPKKKKATKKRAAPMSHILENDIMLIKPEPNMNRSLIPSMAPLTSFLPHHHMMSSSGHVNMNMGPSALCNKIIAETSETVLFNMKHWSPQDYALFVEGLISVQEEKDNTLKCMSIREKYLPQYSLEEVLKCYSLLQNVAMKETQPPIGLSFHDLEGNDSKRMRLMNPPTPELISHFNPIPYSSNMNESMSMRFPYGNPYQMGSMRYPSASPFPYQGHSENNYFPAFPSGLESNQSNSNSNNQRSNQMEMIPRINPPSNENEYETVNYH